MKKFLCKAMCLFICIWIIDILAGQIFPYLISNAKGGDNKRNNYICNQTCEDILIFGSSRAIHHYNPTLFTDSTGASCYNCGQNGNGIILHYGRLKMIVERYHPKYIIYDITPGFDLLAGDDNHKYLNWLKAYYDRNGIAEIFESVDAMEKYKMMSNLYRYNSKFVQIVSDNLIPMQSVGIKGFRPLKGNLDSLKINRQRQERKISPNYDPLKLKYFQKLIEMTQKSRLIFVISPIWYGMDEATYRPIKELCEAYHIPFYNFANCPRYVHHDIYFRDGSHMNAYGADEFTKDLLSIITSELTLQ
ncbi:MAG: hypothetical protein MR319_00035 [Mediterranea sp.]|nr:hypothetical protein [Mediterranea sp.]